MGVETDLSIWANLRRIFLDFDGVVDFLISLLLLAFKAGFLVGGFLIIKYANKVVRAKIDEKGFYFQQIPRVGNKYDKLAMDLNPLKYVPFAEIKAISYRKSFWLGGLIDLTTSSETIVLTALGALKDSEKHEIVQIVTGKLEERRKAYEEHLRHPHY